jgi:hypothetical protein
MHRRVRALVLVSGLMAQAACARVAVAAEQGDVLWANNVGVPLYTHDFDTGKDVTVGDRLYLSEFMGAHYFVTSRVRVGLMFQLTAQLSGDLPAGADHLATAALLPQVAWNFYDHVSAGAIFVYAPRAGGKDQYDLGVQALVGYGLPVTRTATLNLALEAPYNFRLNRTIGITPLVGLSFPL